MVGLYTSPHLISVRERMRINSLPITEEQFAKYFFEVWDALEESALREGRDPSYKPNYFRFLTLMSFHVSIREAIDVAIYEVGVGGAWDSTKIVGLPAVTGITTLGMDHVAVLGDTIEKISWHKAGIFKPGRPAFTVEQIPEAAQVLEECASKKGVHLETVKIDPAMSDIKIVPDAGFQRQNASLAVSLVNAVIDKLGNHSLTDEDMDSVVKNALENTVWRGRCEVKIDGYRHWDLDGAHTVDSLKVAARWFAGEFRKSSLPSILIFNQQSRPEAPDLLRTLQRTFQVDHQLQFDHVIFCTNVTRLTGYRKGQSASSLKESCLTLQSQSSSTETAMQMPLPI